MMCSSMGNMVGRYCRWDDAMAVSLLHCAVVVGCLRNENYELAPLFCLLFGGRWSLVDGGQWTRDACLKCMKDEGRTLS